jgi:hypothetical protein
MRRKPISTRFSRCQLRNNVDFVIVTYFVTSQVYNYLIGGSFDTY